MRLRTERMKMCKEFLSGIKKLRKIKSSNYLMVFILVILVCGCSKQPKLGKWNRYEAEDRSFAIKMPGKYNKINNAFPIPGGEVKTRAMECINEEAVFTAGFYIYP